MDATAVTLWDGLPMEDALIPPDPGLSLEERFHQFDQRNPHVYEALRRLALDLANRGRTRIGVKALVEVLRWHVSAWQWLSIVGACVSPGAAAGELDRPVSRPALPGVPRRDRGVRRPVRRLDALRHATRASGRRTPSGPGEGGMKDNVTPLHPVGMSDPAIRRAVQLATERLVRQHLDEFKKFLRQELRRTGDNPEGAA